MPYNVMMYAEQWEFSVWVADGRPRSFCFRTFFVAPMKSFLYMGICKTYWVGLSKMYILVANIIKATSASLGDLNLNGLEKKNV